MFLKISAKQEKEERHVLSENQKDVRILKIKSFVRKQQSGEGYLQTHAAKLALLVHGFIPSTYEYKN